MRGAEQPPAAAHGPRAQAGAGVTGLLAAVRRDSFELLTYLLVAGIVVLSIYKPGHQTRQLDLVAAAALLAAVALSRPTLMQVVLVGSLAFIPAYAFKTVGVFPGEMTALVALVMAIALAVTPNRVRGRTMMTSLDWVFVVLAALMLGAVISSTRSFTEWAQDMVLWLAPFVCARMLATSAANRDRIARAFVISGVLLSPFVLVEAVTKFNPFQRYLLHGSSLVALGASHLRAGVSRAAGSFGQPIALSMFLAVCLLLGVGFVLSSRTQRGRRRWLAACGVLLVCQVATVSRTGWLMLSVAVVYAAVMLPDPAIRRRLRMAATLGVVTIALVGQLGPLSISAGIPVFGKSNAETRASSGYRSGLLRVALTGGVLQPWGNQTSALADRVIPNYDSIDNEYILMADRFGYLPALVLLAVPLLLLLSPLWFRPTREIDVMIMASGLSLTAAVGTVAFITQQQVLFWLVLGMCSGLFAARRSRASAATSQHAAEPAPFNPRECRTPMRSRSMRIGVVYEGGGAWNQIGPGLADGLRAMGMEVVTIRADLGRFGNRAVSIFSRRVHPVHRADAPIAALQDARLIRARRDAGEVDLWVQMGSTITAPRRAPFVTFEDMTVPLALREEEYVTVGARTRARWIAAQGSAYRQAQRCFIASEWGAASISADFGIPRDKVTVVGLGHSFAFGNLDLKRWDRPVFLWVGADWRRKNGERVIRAFTAVRERFPNAVLHVVGNHPALGTPGVVGHGYLAQSDPLERAQLQRLFAESTCFVMPSRSEPFGIVYVEAGAAGTASIGGSYGGAADAIGDGGLCVDPDHGGELEAAMLELCEPELAERLGRLAYAHSARFTWPKIAERMLSTLQP